jgi:hypothetical protein
VTDSRPTEPRHPVPSRGGPVAGQRLAAGYVLACLAVVLFVLLLLRGAGRIAVPVALAVVVGLLVRRVWRRLRAPV